MAASTVTLSCRRGRRGEIDITSILRRDIVRSYRQSGGGQHRFAGCIQRNNAPSVVDPFMKVIVPVGTVVVPAGGETIAVSVTLAPAATLVLLAESVVDDVSGVSCVTAAVVVSGFVLAASRLPAPSVAME